jgi:predicted NUDIX family NTP pyrophosphohydrolase
MVTLSAGVALVRGDRLPQLLIVHPGGPFWANTDVAGWSIPKGLVDTDERPVEAARREFQEETGLPAPDAEELSDLGVVALSSAKALQVFAARGTVDIGDGDLRAVSSTFEMRWPPKTGPLAVFPEVDRAEWVDLETARVKLHKGQRPLVDLLEIHLQG